MFNLAVIPHFYEYNIFYKLSLQYQLSAACLPVNFVKFLRTFFFIEHLW